MKPHTWSTYPTGLQRHILNPSAMGTFGESPFLKVTGKEETPGNTVVIHLLVDEEDGLIADARFQAYGDSALVGIADMACAKILRKSYIQAAHLSLDVPESVYSHFNLVLCAIQEAAAQCNHISATPLELPTDIENLPDWEEMTEAAKLAAIKKVIATEIQPYVELDAGGVEVLALDGNHVTIAYEGTCTSCHAATGSTLTAIQQILRTKLFKELTVTPDMSLLTGENPGY